MSSGRPSLPGIVNAMTVDVEDYFQVQAFADWVSRADWERLPSRVERNTDAVLEIFDRAGVRGTFFTLGWVAERHPALIRRIVAAGHELASHGYEHRRADEQSPDAFRADVTRTKSILEDAGGVRVAGYRAATFSIGARNLWAFDVLAEAGYAYSSSVYPVRHDLYGMPGAPRFPYRPSGAALTEIPITTNVLLGRNVPSGGGGYFRLFPYAWSRWSIRRFNRIEQQPAIFYFHPWEIDPEQPVQSGISLKARLRHYTNLGRMRARLERLLKEFRWGRVDAVYGLGS